MVDVFYCDNMVDILISAMNNLIIKDMSKIDKITGKECYLVGSYILPVDSLFVDDDSKYLSGLYMVGGPFECDNYMLTEIGYQFEHDNQFYEVIIENSELLWTDVDKKIIEIFEVTNDWYKTFCLLTL